MSSEVLRSVATNQLQLVLSFFSRVESRLAMLLGVDLSMLALLASTAPPAGQLDARSLLAVLPALLVLASLYHIWHGFFPQLDGGKLDDTGAQSLVFFVTISKRNESLFVEQFRGQTEDAYIRDLLGQVWRNSDILSQKFDHLKSAFLWMLVALLPWIVVLAVFAAQNTGAKRLLG
jgi:hypothetical protein